MSSNTKSRAEAYVAKTAQIVGIEQLGLQHWLRVLPKKELEVEVSAHCLYAIYGLESDICFNLTTGQPATEADYQALLTIFGI